MVIAALLLAVTSSIVHPKRIPWIGIWPDNRQIRTLEIPPSYDPQMDTLISLEEAFILWKDGKAIFLDTRGPEEYIEGHIPGSINLPFEHWKEFWDSAKIYLRPGLNIVTYCGGLDCELSLYAARELKSLGYGRPLIFFGGYIKWIEQGLPIDHGQKQ